MNHKTIKPASIRFVKTFGFTILVLLSVFTNSIAQKSCPLNFNGQTLKTAKAALNSWDGKIIACDVEVIQVEKSYQNKPYCRVKLDDDGELWMGSLIISGFENIGAKLRVLGYFVKTENTLDKFNKDGFHLLAFAIIDLSTKKMAMLPGKEYQIREWLNGSVPLAEK